MEAITKKYEEMKAAEEIYCIYDEGSLEQADINPSNPLGYTENEVPYIRIDRYQAVAKKLHEGNRKIAELEKSLEIEMATWTLIAESQYMQFKCGAPNNCLSCSAICVEHYKAQAKGG